MRKDAPFAVDVPDRDRDSPGWVKVGVIAAVGFVIGIAWPRVMGVKLGPSAPGESSSAAASAKASGARASEAPPASVAAAKASAQPAISASTTAAASASGAASAGGPPQINVQKGAVLSCKTSDGDVKKGKECGAVAGLDMLVAPRIKKVATCSAAEGQTGKLSFVVNADFSKNTFGWDVGKSSTVGNIEGITGCLKTHFQGVGTAGVPHEHAKYTVAYTATFAPSAESPKDDAKNDKPDAKDEKTDAKAKDTKDDKPEQGAIAAGAEVAIAWEVALVRDAPKTGGVVARLPRGTKVKIGSSKDGWYAIKYGDGFASDGFVYRGALGR
ncbi:MAG: hypothetical protein JST00_38370 [Deltaproteobacteria bacterium]|nr:hypothetical protein [Deltaproteobacteria bacterium]